ncbi:unnamed protein product [Nippostrongylus brasiliensis]|uniref:Secreted protein n=1 Tax=Nippostrongylus brasiliensis TaxID=27835 RepID=A0A0N4YSK0_NIPBR|nr:unnamed protein product [Nippostrongylus brasiliensis]
MIKTRWFSTFASSRTSLLSSNRWTMRTTKACRGYCKSHESPNPNSSSTKLRRKIYTKRRRRHRRISPRHEFSFQIINHIVMVNESGSVKSFNSSVLLLCRRFFMQFRYRNDSTFSLSIVLECGDDRKITSAHHIAPHSSRFSLVDLRMQILLRVVSDRWL